MLNDTLGRRVGVVATGAGNTASLYAALRRAGGVPYAVDDAEGITAASHLVVPGVGAFGPVVAALRQQGVLPALRQRVEYGAPTLAICVGMQILFAASDESPGATGLRIVPQQVEALRQDKAGRPWTHFGWARIGADGRHDFAYFAHAFAAKVAPTDWHVRFTAAEPRFVAEMQRGDVLACQYHPEISGRYGGDVIRNWLWRAST